jgi:hypothetical protein
VFGTQKEKSAQTGWQKQYKYRTTIFILARFLRIAEIHLCALQKSSSAQVWGAVYAAVLKSAFSVFWVGLFDDFWLSLLGALALVGYWFATGILLSVKVKVLGGGISAYGWVTILLYCLWLNEHTHFTNMLYPLNSFIQYNYWKEAKP